MKRKDMIGNKYAEGKIPWNKGKTMSKDFREKIRQANKKRFKNNPESYIKIKFKPEPSPELAYLLGIRYGDGTLCISNKWYQFRLGAIDKEFVEEFRRCGCKILKKRDKPKISKKIFKNEKWSNMYYCNFSSKKLYIFLSKPLVDHKKIIERHHTQFIRGFFDSEGSFSLNSNTHLRASNTNKETIRYIKQLLEKNKINLHLYKEKRGKNLKTMYTIGTGKRNEIEEYANKIGFIIKRKQKLMLTYINKRPTSICELCNKSFFYNSGIQKYCQDCKKLLSKVGYKHVDFLKKNIKKFSPYVLKNIKKITRVTADIDNPADLPSCINVFIKYGYDDIKIRRSPSQKGFHVEGWTSSEGHALFYNLLIRLLAKDDYMRVYIDAMGKRAVQILFSEKKKRKLYKKAQTISFDETPMQYETKGIEQNVKISIGEI